MEELFLKKYKILNAEQKEAVDTIDGPVFVMAGPGTGKTQILILRIANILRLINGIEPENILALTFTNAGAYNMKIRLGEMIGPELAQRVEISTFHSFAERCIKNNPDYFPKYIQSRLISQIEQIELVNAIIENKKDLVFFSKFKQRDTTVKSIISAIGKIKNEALDVMSFRKKIDELYDVKLDEPEMFYKKAFGKNKKGDIKQTELKKLNDWRDKSYELASLYEEYQNELSCRHFYDFSDIILSFVSELKKESDFRTEIQEQYQYILVDEHQDTNDAQNDILFALIDNPVWERKPNIFVVGDSKQAIFRFAGASETAYKKLFTSLDDIKLINLQKNYRSHQNILDISHDLIIHSDFHREEQKLEAFFDHGGEIEYRRFQKDKMELLFVVQDIKKRIENGENPNDIAVLYRKNKDGEQIQRLLSVFGIPVRDFSKKNLLKDSDVLKLFLIMRSLHDLEDDEVLAKSLYIDFLNLPVFSVGKIINAVKQKRDDTQKSIFQFISDKKKLQSLGIPENEQNPFVSYARILSSLKTFSENNDFLLFFSQCIRESGFLNYILSQQGSSYALSKIEKVFDEVRKEIFSRESFNFDDFISYLNIMKRHNISMDMVQSSQDGVQLMTFHGSKGLEFDTVYIIHMNALKKIGSEIKLPFDDFSNGDTDDERRLFYVAMTRAKKSCYISSFVVGEDGREKNESSFVSDIKNISCIDMQTWEKDHYKDIASFFFEEQQHIANLLDKEYIEKIFFSKQLSVSALNNYIDSPLKYFFRNLIALPEARSHFLDFGNIIHESLEDFFKKVMKEIKTPSINDLEKSLDFIVKKHYYYREFKDRAWKILKEYYQHYKDTFDIPTDVEFGIYGVPFEYSEGEQILLSGKIDKITQNDDGSYTVWDYKTGTPYTQMSSKRKEKIKRQAVFYKILLSRYCGGRYNFKTAIFDFVEKNKKGEYEQKIFTIEQSDVDEVFSEIQELIRDIKEDTLLNKKFEKNDENADLLEFLDIMRGPQIFEQKKLFD